MVNKGIDHVRQFAKENGLSYACALSTAECKASYQSSKVQKVNPKDKAFADLSSMVEQAKQLKKQLVQVEPQQLLEQQPLYLIQQHRLIQQHHL